MNLLKQLYHHSLSLLTDLYQLTMAYGYWKTRKMDQEAVFTLFFRKPPFQGGYTIAAGLETALSYLENLQFTKNDLEYLLTLTGANGNPLFEKDFLDYLGQLHWALNIDAIPEGTVVFPHEPLLRVQGPLLQCQLVETALLNIINFQTLLATKAARVCQAAQGQPVLEFGLRRAQGIDGALTASRAAYIGGCAATSNVLAGKLYGIPVKGTHAHSWVMSFPNEAEAFQAYAEALPHNCIFLVDTFETLKGVKQAITTAQWLRDHHYPFLGIRLDSGDLVTLSQESRTLLNAAGFPEARIVASNDLDEYQIADLKTARAAIDTWGVGTKLVTSYDQPALGGVYKLTAIRDDGDWQYRLKLSDDPLKISNPGLLQVRRCFTTNGASKTFTGDWLYNEWQPPMPPSTPYEDLLTPVLRQTQRLGESPSLTQIRSRVEEQLAALPEAMKRFKQPAIYPVNLEEGLYRLKKKLIDEAGY